MQMRTDFAPGLQVLFHTALDCFRTPTYGLNIEQLLEECEQSSKDLCTILFEHFGKHIVQPRRDLFKKATQEGISVI